MQGKERRFRVKTIAPPLEAKSASRLLTAMRKVGVAEVQSDSSIPPGQGGPRGGGKGPAAVEASHPTAAKPKVIVSHDSTKYENSYIMGPTRAEKFNATKVGHIIEEYLAAKLTGVKFYNAEKCSLLAKTLSTEIKDHIKTFGYKRYKLVCLVTIGQKKRQDVHICSRCIWDTDKDNYASASYESSRLFACATVYGMYCE